MDLNTNQPQSPNGNTVTDTSLGLQVLPIFPPQNFEVPDIIHSTSTTNSCLESMAMVANSINTSSHNGTILSSAFQQSTETPSTGTQMRSTGTSPPISRESSTEDSDDSLPLAKLAQLKRQAGGREKSTTPPPVSAPATTTGTGKTRKTPKKRRKKDPNEPQKPVSAYALFFRDTQAAIKGQNPSASFGEVSKIVASMWDGLDPETKGVYKKKTEMAKKEYLKQLAAYRASLVSQLPMDDTFGDSMLDKTRLTRSSIHAVSPNISPHQHSPSLSPNHGNNLSPMHAANLSPHGLSPMHHGPNSSPQGHTMSPQGPNISPPGHGMSPASHGMSPMHGGQLGTIATSPQHGGNMSPAAMENMGMIMGYGMSHHSTSPIQMGYTSPMHMNNSPPERQPLVPSTHRNQQNIAQRQPVLGQLMEEANLCLEGGGMLQSMCVRNGCTNPTIDNSGWDNEYCSNECVVSHCRDVFTAWVSARQSSG